MKLDWRNMSAYVICIVPEGKMYAYATDSGKWYIPMVATANHDGILPMQMTGVNYDSRESVIDAMEGFYFSQAKDAQCDSMN